MKTTKKPKTTDAPENVTKASSKGKKRKNKYGISEDYTGNEERFLLKMATVVLKKKAVPIIIMTVIFAAFVSVLFIINDQSKSEATMMLNYEQSVDGLAPNATRFNISDFQSEDVVNQIIKNAGLENEITTEEMKNSISITSVISKEPTSEVNYYIPTSFRIAFVKPKAIENITADDMLEVICNTYSQYFYDQYTMNAQILDDNYDFDEDMEYSQIGAFMKVRIDAISDYLRMRAQTSGKFVSESTGETFNSVKKRVDNIKDYDLVNYNAFIWENGIVHNISRYTNTRLYLNSTHSRDKKRNLNEYLIRREVIEYYNNIMSTSILIPTVNDKNNYYMARTKTGVDYLASDAANFLDSAKFLEKTIRTDTDKLSKVEPTMIPENHKKADIMIKNMTEEMEEIEDLAIQIDKEYKEEYAKNYITFEVDNAGIIQSLPKKNILLATAGFMLVAFYVYFKECCYIAKRGRTK